MFIVYNFEHGDVDRYTLQDTVKVGIYEDLMIDFRKMNIKEKRASLIVNQKGFLNADHEAAVKANARFT